MSEDREKYIDEIKRRLSIGEYLIKIREKFYNNEWKEYLKNFHVSAYLADGCIRMATKFSDPMRRERMLALCLPLAIIDLLSRDYVPLQLVDRFLEEVKMKEGRMNNAEYRVLFESIQTAMEVSTFPIGSSPINTKPLITHLQSKDRYQRLREIAIQVQQISHSLIELADFPE